MRVTRLFKQQINIVRDKLSGGQAPMAATDLLEMQHREVDMLFAKIAKADSPRDKKVLLEKLADSLSAHMQVEQELFYPAVKRETDQASLVTESFEEHDVAQYELLKLIGTSTSDPEFDARVTVLRELVHHHVMEEERELFPQVEKQMAKERRMALGHAMRERFNVLLAQGFRTVLGLRELVEEQPAPAPSESPSFGSSIPKKPSVEHRVSAKTGAKPRKRSKKS